MRKFVSAFLCLSISFFMPQMLLASRKSAKAAKGGGFVKINLNTSSYKELKKIPGISSSKAKRIVAYREENGGLQSVEDLKNISHETKSGKTSYDFATSRGKWKKAMRPLLENEVFTVKGGADTVDIDALYKHLYPKPLDINSASLNKLKSLPGISKKKAMRIADNRPYSSLDGLKSISHQTKSGHTSYDFATKKGKWRKSFRTLVETGRLICSPSESNKSNYSKNNKSESSDKGGDNGEIYDEEY